MRSNGVFARYITKQRVRCRGRATWLVAVRVGDVRQACGYRDPPARRRRLVRVVELRGGQRDMRNLLCAERWPNKVDATRLIDCANVMEKHGAAWSDLSAPDLRG